MLYHFPRDRGGSLFSSTFCSVLFLSVTQDLNKLSAAVVVCAACLQNCRSHRAFKASTSTVERLEAAGLFTRQMHTL